MFPEISNFCEKRGIEFTGIDLRTGVTAEQSENGMTLNLCLQEVERCRPYFLCLLGERYGWCQPTHSEAETDELLHKTFENTISQYPIFNWISNYTKSSVTELEIRQGYLNSPGDCEHAIFLFRNPEYVNEALHEGLISVEEIPSFLPESEDTQVRLNNLKDEIKTSGAFVKEYNHHSDIHQIVTKFLKEAIVNDFPDSEGTGDTRPFVMERREHQGFGESRCKVYVGEPKYYDALNEYISHDGDSISSKNSIFHVYGPSGSGKSSLLANWVHLLSCDNGQLNVSVRFSHVHFVGCSATSANPTKMLHRLLSELKYSFLCQNDDNTGVGKGNEDLPFDWARLLLLLPEVLCDVSSKLERENDNRPEGSRPLVVVLVLDALNQLTTPDNDDSSKSGNVSVNQSYLSWLPKILPPFVRLVVSSIERPDSGDVSLPSSISQCVTPTSNILEVLPLDAEGVRGIAVSYMSGYGKALGENQIKMLMACEQTKNPLFLRAVLEEIRVWGKFELLTDVMSSYLKKETIGELFDAILTRLERDFNTAEYPNLVHDAMCALWGSHSGLTETELHGILQSPRCVFSGLFLSIRQSLTNRNGYLYFFHDYLKKTIENKYLGDFADRKFSHIMIAEYFCSLAATAIADSAILYADQRKRCAVEVTWQLACCDQYSLVGDYICLPSVAKLLFDNCKVNLFKVLRSCGIKKISCAFLKECTWLLNEEHDSENGGHENSNLADCNEFDKIRQYLQVVIAAERNIMINMSKHERINLVKQMANMIIQSAEYETGRELLGMALKFCEMGGEQCVSIVAEQARLCLILSRYEEGILICEPIVKDFVSLKTQSDSKENESSLKKQRFLSSYMDIVHVLAKLYSTNGQFSEADPLYQIVLDDRISQFGQYSPRTADVMNDLAKHKFSQKQYDDALDLYQQVLTTRRATAGENSPSFIATVLDIGSLHHDLANYEKAERYFKNALRISEIVFGQSHPNVADVLNELGFTRFMKDRKDGGEFQECLSTYQRALAIRETNFGYNHISIANTLNHMANVHRNKYDCWLDAKYLDEAISLYHRAKEIKENLLHSKHPEVLLSRNNLANVLLMHGKYSEAAEEHVEILRIRQDLYGADNLQTATSLKNCGLAYFGLGDMNRSLDFHVKALNIRQKGLGLLHPKTAESFSCCGDTYMMLKQNEDAIAHYEGAVTAWNHIHGEGNHDSLRGEELINKLSAGEDLSVDDKLHCFF